MPVRCDAYLYLYRAGDGGLAHKSKNLSQHRSDCDGRCAVAYAFREGKPFCKPSKRKEQDEDDALALAEAEEERLRQLPEPAQVTGALSV